MTALSEQLGSVMLFLTSSLLGSLLLFLASRPARRDVVGSAALGGCLLALGWIPGQLGTNGLVGLAYWGATATFWMLGLGLVAVRGAARRTALVQEMVVGPVLNMVAVIALTSISRLLPGTYDHYLYAFDGSLGFQPSFWMGALLERHPWLQWTAAMAYIHLPLAATAVYVALQAHRPRQRGSFLRLMIGVAAVAMPLYSLFPAVGTAVLGGVRFPFDPLPLTDIPVVLTPDIVHPRNCMPSLHTSWGVALWLSAAGLPRRFQLAVGSYLALMLLHTLGCGHYLADMTASLPFLLGMYACTRALPLRSHAAFRWTAAGGFAGFLVWLALIRCGALLGVALPAIAVGASVLTVLLCVASWRRLWALEREWLDQAALMAPGSGNRVDTYSRAPLAGAAAPGS